MSDHDCRGVLQRERIANAIAEAQDGDTLIVGSMQGSEIALALLTEQMPALENVHVVVRTVDGTSTPDVAERHGDGPRAEFVTDMGAVIVDGRKVQVIPRSKVTRGSGFYPVLGVLTAARGVHRDNPQHHGDATDVRLDAAIDCRHRARPVGGGVYEIDLDE